MEEPLLASPLDQLIQNVRANRYRPFSRGKHIRELQGYIFNSPDLSRESIGDLLSVINDCLFTGQIEDILTQNAHGPCLLAWFRFEGIDLTKYPAIQKVSEKHQDTSLLLHKFIEEMSEDLSDDKIRNVFQIFKKYDANFNAKDAKGNTPLHIAASEGLFLTEVVRAGEAGQLEPLTGGTFKILVDEFGAIPELVNNRNQTPLEVVSHESGGGQTFASVEAYVLNQTDSTFIAIEKRDVKHFSECVDMWGLLQNRYKRHEVFGTPIEYLQKLINDYEKEKEKGWHTFGQWNRNRKLKKMLDIALNHVLGELKNELSDKVTFFLGLLNEFSPEKIAEALWRDVRRNGSRLFKFIEDNVRGFSNVAIATENMRQSEGVGRTALPFRVGTVVSSFTAVTRAISGDMEAVEQQPEVFEPVFAKPINNNRGRGYISKWLDDGGNPNDFEEPWLRIELSGGIPASAYNYEGIIGEMIEKGHWKLLFLSALKTKLDIPMSARQYIFEEIMSKYNDRDSVTSKILIDFISGLKEIKEPILSEAFLPAVAIAQPRQLMVFIAQRAREQRDQALQDIVGRCEKMFQENQRRVK